MLLLAGLVGLFASGVMIALPSEAETEAAEVEVPQIDSSDDEVTAGGGLDAYLGEDSVGTDAAVEADSSAASDGSQADRDLPPRDVLGGDHLTDRLDGSSVAPIRLDGDAMYGNGSDDKLAGGVTNDLIIGNGGDDALFGGDGRDILMGGDGNDKLAGGSGADELHGDAGDDHLDGGLGDDLLSGGDGDDMLAGGDGDDRLFGGAGSDTLDGGAGNDILDGSVLGDDGTDRDAGDRLIGGDGDDTIAGGMGDVLVGGAGSDLYMVQSGGGAANEDEAPMIEDFDPEQDEIEIVYETAKPPTLSIIERMDVTRILVDGMVVAQLKGAPGIELSHLRLVSAA
ncbi:calcium-binding protein [Jannaschia rubra]|uniref:Hemolysin, chromosomal n=1 Tax=Jannaschia rubra TaxID=282197 RepID=A0A0M6XM00_9RHOB|nr:calcium-binding protein [Jannaschia rubra]CTQ31597.1 Hemolysin, chromosomal [Jannaschia rubra]SFF76592.1 Hemolysin-type calcium-binding repeat-containing protein [Jannaschia rubra]